MKTVLNTSVMLSAILFLLAHHGMARMFWQITHDGWGQGECILEANAISVTLHPTHMDVVEEGIIKTLPNNRVRGDLNSLEIAGDFWMPPGTALRGMLLWNGDQILQAKLKDRRTANEEYEKVVDRNAVQPVIRDPALIEYQDNGRYDFKIYPVEMGKSRKIRILYTVPLIFEQDGFMFKLQPVFEQNSSIIKDKDLSVRLGEDVVHPIILKQGTNHRMVRNGVYTIPARQKWAHYNAIQQRNIYLPQAIHFRLSSLYKNKAYVYKADSGPGEGYYAMVHTRMPDTMKSLAANEAIAGIKFDAFIKAGEKRFVSNVANGNAIKILMKSDEPWNRKIYWSAYDNNGELLAEYTQTLSLEDEAESHKIIPLLWAANYSTNGAREGLGAVYGFVDRKMSLLALEDDVMPIEQAKEIGPGEVPELTADLIIVDPHSRPRPPDNHAVIDIATPIAKQDAIAVNSITITGNFLLLRLSDSLQEQVLVQLFDLNGRLVYSVKNGLFGEDLFKLQLPGGLKGRFVLQLTIGEQVLRRNVTLKG